MTRRAGKSYPVDDDWRRRVAAALRDKGMNRSDLARAADCSRSVISELLSGAANESPFVPAIHVALEWSPPLPPVLPEDAEELLAHWAKLDPVGKARLLERAAMLAEAATKKRP